MIEQSKEESYLPRQVGIDAYGNGGFHFADMSHKGSLLCLPNGMHAWQVKSAAEISKQTLKLIFEQADNIDILLVGLGEDIAFFDAQIRAELRQHSVIVEAISTSAAISTYNVLVAEKRSVAAALIAVERSKK